MLTVPPLQHKSSLEAVAMPLDIVYEDPHLMILNKPPNISVHPAPSIKEATLVNGLLDYCQNNLSSINDDTRPGIVHRIDKNTSGLIVIAKHNRAHKHLAYQFETHGVYRRYVALVWGYPPINNTIDAPLKRDPYNRLKISVQKNGSRAITHTHVLNYLKPLQCTLLECRLETGRTHQIRVHLSHKGYPLMGDPIYGKNLHSKINTLPMHAQKALQNFSRQALHAQDLGFIHPITAKPLMFSSPLPLDFKNLYQALHNSIL